MTQTGAVAVVEHKQTITEIVNEAVGGGYTPAYVAAMKELLPPDFHNAPSLIALGIRARKSGLDPFTEIHAWKNERGKLQFQIARDGFIYIASNDPNVESLDFQHVYEGESFEWSKGGDGRISITHRGGLVKGDLLGAYCCAHMNHGSDHLEMRVVSNYTHLMKKANWQYLPEMLITRVIGACVRLVCPDRAGGLYSEADMELAEVGERERFINSTVEEATTMKVDVAVAELREKKTQEEDPPTVEAEIHNQYACPECDRWFDTQQGLAGHMRSHKKHESAQPMAETEEDAVDPTPAATDDTPTDASPGKDTAGPVADTSGDSHPAVVPHDSGLEIPKGYQVFVDRGGQYVVQYTDPATSEVTEIGRYPTADDAALAAQNHEYQLTQSVPSEVKLADIYAWMRLNRVPATAVADIINDTIYEDEFERFREEGAEKISSFNLDPDARRTLFEIVKQRHG